MERGFAVIGLGYVGLPVALALANNFAPVIGFDISKRRIVALREWKDTTGEVGEAALRETKLRITDEADALNEASFFIVTVPTPIDSEHRPDLSPLESACALIGPRLNRGSVVVFESTVYPGLTREYCGRLLAKHSGLRQGVDFKLGYSPERRCQLSGPRGPFPGPARLSGAAQQASEGVPRPEPPRHRYDEHTTAA